ncbi:HDOD domain-containing protein [Marinobacter sp. JSM 1782161]|uniref:HDOD domain-containing protein n=1 Tax=Marinobacter sp. JSM 1782161 TaxID=2685906 RepID=UPI0014028E28|nr:HDOD domain-containing protein [Marinobacter sp. JSM 1782161]
MNILVLEDDPLMAELLETVVLGLYPQARATLVHDLHAAEKAWAPDRFALLLCDWNLPEGSGLDFVRYVREADAEVPVVMISGRADRQSVLTAAKYQINGFITKPFQADLVHERLKKLLPVEEGAALNLEGPEAALEEALGGQVLLPTSLDPGEVLAMIQREDPISVSQLAERWRDDKSLVTRLLNVANGSAYRRSGEPVASLRDAIHILGVKMALNLGLSVALNHAHDLRDPRLQARARDINALSDALAREASRMARLLDYDRVACYTAGLLGRVGELAVFSVLQQYLDQGGTLADEDIDALSRQWAQSLGNRLKVQWRLPLELRELVGAIHSLPHGSSHQSRLLMRAASLLTSEGPETKEYLSLMRRIGLEPVQKQDEPDETGGGQGRPGDGST